MSANDFSARPFIRGGVLTALNLGSNKDIGVSGLNIIKDVYGPVHFSTPRLMNGTGGHDLDSLA